MFARFFSKKTTEKSHNQIPTQDQVEPKLFTDEKGQVWEDLTHILHDDPKKGAGQRKETQKEEKPKERSNPWSRLMDLLKGIFRGKTSDLQAEQQKQPQKEKIEKPRRTMKQVFSVLNLPSLNFKHRMQVTKERAQERALDNQRQR